MIGTTGRTLFQHPAADIGLPVVVVPHGCHGTISPQAHLVPVACDDLDNTRPAANIPLPVEVVPCSDHGAVGLKPHSVILACGDLGDVRPVVDIAPVVKVESRGDHGADPTTCVCSKVAVI
jgi:hypothetical protein